MRSSPITPMMADKMFRFLCGGFGWLCDSGTPTGGNLAARRACVRFWSVLTAGWVPV